MVPNRDSSEMPAANACCISLCLPFHPKGSHVHSPFQFLSETSDSSVEEGGER